MNDHSVAACVQTGAEESAVDHILRILGDSTGVDFFRYRRATVVRRIRNRMVSVRLERLHDYVRHLSTDPEEPSRLAERIAIKVSRFYRNAPVFDFLRDDVLPCLARDRGRALRLWSAGCGCGEEPYTLAMLLEDLQIPGTVDATDIDTHALTKPDAGVYPIGVPADLPRGWVDRYLEPTTYSRERLHKPELCQTF